jgi:OOP family OmpA-OmpF porin
MKPAHSFKQKYIKDTHMKLIKTSGILTCMVLAAMTSSLTLADDAGWYIGGNLGQTRADIDEDRIAASLLQSGFYNTLVKDDSAADHGYKLFGGYQFNRYVAVEGGYFDLGQFGFTSTTQPTGTFNGNIKLRGVNLDLVGFVPFTEKLSAFGRLGVNYAEAKDKFSGTGFVHVLSPTAKERDTNLKVGAGLQYAFNDNLAMRLEAERYRIGDAVGHKGDVDLLSVGLVYRFGAKAAPVAVIAAPPAPAPVAAPVVEPPPAPRFEKYTLSATELFTFDSSAVNMPQAKLEEITTAIKGPGSPKQVVIVGYTDRLGSDEYNQKLSERRALAVKEYMVNRGIAADRLVAEGKGEADPIVECTDKNKAALIKCLSPNRRVEIDEVKMVREVKK